MGPSGAPGWAVPMEAPRGGRVGIEPSSVSRFRRQPSPYPNLPWASHCPLPAHLQHRPCISTGSVLAAQLGAHGQQSRDQVLGLSMGLWLGPCASWGLSPELLTPGPRPTGTDLVNCKVMCGYEQSAAVDLGQALRQRMSLCTLPSLRLGSRPTCAPVAVGKSLTSVGLGCPLQMATG